MAHPLRQLSTSQTSLVEIWRSVIRYLRHVSASVCLDPGAWWIRPLQKVPKTGIFQWPTNQDRNFMRKIGYARVSAPHQNLDRQVAALRAERCDQIYREKASGKALKGRPELEKAIDALPTKGILVLAEWDRATRSLMDGIHIMERVHKRGAYIKVLDRPGLDLTTPSGRGILALLSGLAEEERHRILKRANEGRTAARARGVRMGRPLMLTPHQQEEALDRLAKGESCRSVARSFNVSHSTVSRLQG
jgi:DNA invertase Pin-like site-specific DNA recombinase